MSYKAIIKNITKNTYIQEEKNGVVKETKDQNKALVFFDECDAESVLELVNSNYPDCYQLIEKPYSRLIIEIERGLVVSVYSDDDREYDVSVLDMDCQHSTNDLEEIELLQTEIKEKNMKEIFGL